MWVTQDGYELVLPRAGVDAVAARLAGGESGGYVDEVRRRVVRDVARLVTEAARAPAVAHSPAGSGRAVFAAERFGRRYAIVTRPVDRGAYVITAVRPVPPEEELRLWVDKTYTVVVTWSGEISLAKLVARKAANHKGVYIMYHRGRPKYVGQAKGKVSGSPQTIALRWQQRLHVFAEFGVPLPNDFVVYAGEVEAFESGTKLAGDAPLAGVFAVVTNKVTKKKDKKSLTAIDLVEAVLIRQLLGGEAAKQLLNGKTRFDITNTMYGNPDDPKVQIKANVRLTINHKPQTPPHVDKVEVGPKAADTTFEVPSRSEP